MFNQISLRRKLVYLCATLIFFVSAAILILFTFGYRFNFQHDVFIYSGTITVKSLPRRVSISLNGKPVEKQSYDIINNYYNLNGIKPGNYHLTVQTEGYQPWEKDIEVHSGVATEFWNVVLAPADPEKTRLDIVNPSYYKVIKEGEEIVYANRLNGVLEVFLYSAKKGTAVKIFEEAANQKFAVSLENIFPSPDQKNLILELRSGEKHYYYLVYPEKIQAEGLQASSVIYLNAGLTQALLGLKANEAGAAPASTELSLTIADDPISSLRTTAQNPLKASQEEALNQANPTHPLTPIQWLDDRSFYFEKENQVYLASPNNNQLTPILKDIAGYTLSQNEIYFIKAPHNLLFKSDKSGGNIEQITDNLIDQEQTNSMTYKIQVYDKQRIAFLNQDHKLYLYNNNRDEYRTFKKINNNATDFQFSDDGKKLLYYNDHEINVYYLKEWEVQPKNDISANLTIYENDQAKITRAVWYKNYQNVLFSLDNQIKLVEIDQRGNVNQPVITTTEATEPNLSYVRAQDQILYLNKSDKFTQLFSITMPNR